MKHTDGIKESNRNREWTPEMRAHMSEIKSGEWNGFLGKQHNAQTRAVMSAKAKARVRIPTKLAKYGFTLEEYLRAQTEGKKWCRECLAFVSKEGSTTSECLCREHLQAKRRKYYAANREMLLAKTKADYEKNTERRRKYAREYRAALSPEECQRRTRRTTLYVKYRIRPEQHASMLLAQRNACAICEKPFEGKPRVDHDHETKAVRELLCHKCNVGLAYLEMLEWKAKAEAYLAKHKALQFLSKAS